MQFFSKIVNYKQPSTGFWPIIPVLTWYWVLPWTHKGWLVQQQQATVKGLECLSWGPWLVGVKHLWPSPCEPGIIYHTTHKHPTLIQHAIITPIKTAHGINSLLSQNRCQPLCEHYLACSINKYCYYNPAAFLWQESADSIPDTREGGCRWKLTLWKAIHPVYNGEEINVVRRDQVLQVLLKSWNKTY